MIFVIGGVTASGKSSLAFRFAKKVNGIIINADAYAFYRELNIGTAKPSRAELESVPTYLFNNISLTDKFSIYDYQIAARAIIEKYKDTNTPIIFVGGSGLYIRAALFNYALQNEVGNELKDDPIVSNESLYFELKTLDPVAAEKIHPNNRKRVLRALTIIKSGKLKSDIDNLTQNTPLYPFTMIALDREKDALNTIIEERVKDMFNKGLKAEALDLLEKYPQNAQGMQAIGYKEIFANQTASDDFLINLISLRTKQYAKRQRTFFRHQFDTKWFSDSEEAFAYLLSMIGDNYEH